MVTINNGIVGTIVFRNELDGCLNAKYINEHERIPYTESCVLQTRDAQNTGFVGDYSTGWFEQIGQQEAADLSIQLNNAGNTNSFDLVWTRQGTPMFRGTGMMYGELLVGAYWSVNQDNNVGQ